MLNKSYGANENTILNLDLTNVAILLEESTDGKIHFDYEITFGRYSKRKREMIKDQVDVSTQKRNDLITLKVNNSIFFGLNHHRYISFDSLKEAVKDYAKTFNKPKNEYKTKDSLIHEIRGSSGTNLRDFIKKNRARYEDPEYLKKRKVFVQRFVIKVPKNMQIRLKGIRSNVTVNYDVESKFVVNTFNGFLKFKKLKSAENVFSITNGIFQAEELAGGDYNFKDVNKLLLGKVSNLKLNAEACKIQIGEIGENVNLVDFDSKINFYNFNQNFDQFRYKGDYSKLWLYNIKKNNYSLDVYGRNTALNMDSVKTTFGEAGDQKMTKILEKRANTQSNVLGNVEIELVNGIVNIINAPKSK
jgi:hypothetical protein